MTRFQLATLVIQIQPDGSRQLVDTDAITGTSQRFQ
jgi:hypothetical protein